MARCWTRCAPGGCRAATSRAPASHSPSTATSRTSGPGCSARREPGRPVVDRSKAPPYVIVHDAYVLHEGIDARRAHESVALRLELLGERLRLKSRCRNVRRHWGDLSLVY